MKVEPNAPGKRARAISGIEVLVFLSWAWFFFWFVEPLRLNWLNSINVVGLICFSAASHLWRGVSSRTIGLGFDTFIPAARRLALPTIAGLCAIVVTSLILGEAEFSLDQIKDLAVRSIRYPFWAFTQQYVFQGYVFIRLREAFGRRWPAIVLTAAAYSLFHTPNMLLMLGGFPVCLIWSWVFSRRPNLYATAISHGLLGAFWAELAAGSYAGGMRVGPQLLLR